MWEKGRVCKWHNNIQKPSYLFFFFLLLFRIIIMRIAAVQFHIDHKDKEINWSRAEEFISKAANNHVDLIVFPE